MTDLEKAMAEFLAKQGATQCAPAATKEDYKAARRTSWQAQEERQRQERAAERAERNAENMRYDSEGVYYIGGKL